MLSGKKTTSDIKGSKQKKSSSENIIEVSIEEKEDSPQIIYHKAMEFGEFCKETQSGQHIYINNICVCGKVIDIIEEDEEEYDEEGKPCPKSNTGNHHFVGGSSNCKYCGILKSPTRMTIRKSIKKTNKQDLSFINNNPISLDEKGRSSKSLFHKQYSREGSIIKLQKLNSNDSLKKVVSGDNDN